MQLYTIGSVVNLSGGHGDNYAELAIRPLGMYGTDGLPPLFYTREEAEALLVCLSKYEQSCRRVVEMSLQDPPVEVAHNIDLDCGLVVKQ